MQAFLLVLTSYLLPAYLLYRLERQVGTPCTAEEVPCVPPSDVPGLPPCPAPVLCTSPLLPCLRAVHVSGFSTARCRR